MRDSTLFGATKFIAPALLAGAFAFSCSAMTPGVPLPPDPGQARTPVIIDAGHGGDDEGAIVRGVREKDLALIFAKKLQARLAKNEDIPTAMTRESDHYVTLNDRLVGSVDQGGSIFVSLHLNQVRSKKVAGAVVYSYGAEYRRKWRKRSHPTVPPMPAPPKVQISDSARLARVFSRTLREDGFKAEASRSDYYVLKNPAAPSVLIELGYLSNPAEAAKLVDPAYQDRMVESLAKAIEEYATSRSATGAVTKL